MLLTRAVVDQILKLSRQFYLELERNTLYFITTDDCLQVCTSSNDRLGLQDKSVSFLSCLQARTAAVTTTLSHRKPASNGNLKSLFSFVVHLTLFNEVSARCRLTLG